MIYRIIIYILGVVITSFNLVYLIIYFSLIKYGMDGSTFLVFLFHQKELYFFLLGIVIISLGLYFDSWWNKFIAYRKGR
jgi:hypothetical protein